MSVLLMLNNTNTRFPVFVANRLAKIEEISSPSQWRFVNSELNAADHVSRGLSALDFVQTSQWFTSPEFLNAPKEAWPENPQMLPDLPYEILKPQRHNISTVMVSQTCIADSFARFSSWDCLKCAIAWILRLKSILRKRNRTCHGAVSLTVDELETSAVEIVKAVQLCSFFDEISLLMSSSRATHKSWRLLKLNPVLVDGILRVGGRLSQSPLAFSRKHPIILPCDRHVTHLIIEDQRQRTGHCGMANTWTQLRQTYWIVKGAATVRKVLGKCVFCRRRNAKLSLQVMSDLPAERLTRNKPPFYFTGVDFFGPFTVRQARSYVKRYGCIFICLASRAVHLEVVHALTVDSFINAFRRFGSCRGKVHTLYSDNDTNFVGAEKELQLSFMEWNKNVLHKQLCQRGVRWQFNSLLANHMGGIWERVIRSVKKILFALLSEQRLTDESLETLLTEVEYILNSRPLTPVVMDSECQEPLTLNHLLLASHEGASLSLGVSCAVDS